ncbi:MerR family DNA-binding protein [Mesorhizobium sp. 10J20-29]
MAQRAGITLAEIADALSQLPMDRVPDTADWAAFAKVWHDGLTTRIGIRDSSRSGYRIQGGHRRLQRLRKA